MNCQEPLKLAAPMSRTARLAAKKQLVANVNNHGTRSLGLTYEQSNIALLANRKKYGLDLVNNTGIRVFYMFVSAACTLLLGNVYPNFANLESTNALMLYFLLFVFPGISTTLFLNLLANMNEEKSLIEAKLRLLDIQVQTKRAARLVR
jgi:hypothetical protein